MENAQRLGRYYDILHEHARFYNTSCSSLHLRSSEREKAHGNPVPQLEDRYHYHHGLRAGENTLAAHLVRVLMRSVIRDDLPEHLWHGLIEIEGMQKEVEEFSDIAISAKGI